MSTILSFRRNTYARNTYIFGTCTLSYIEGFAPEYVEPVKQYAAETYTKRDLKDALGKGFITQEEYDETIAYIKP